WAIYKGVDVTDGSILVQGRIPVPVRDTGKGELWYNKPFEPKDTFPAGKSKQFRKYSMRGYKDLPSYDHDLVLTNRLTKQRNFLHEVQLEFHFCTVWAAQDPKGDFHHLAHFNWAVHWQFTFRPADFSKPKGPWLPPKPNPQRDTNGIFIGGPFPGGPTHPAPLRRLPGAAPAGGRRGKAPPRTPQAPRHPVGAPVAHPGRSRWT